MASNMTGLLLFAGLGVGLYALSSKSTVPAGGTTPPGGGTNPLPGGSGGPTKPSGGGLEYTGCTLEDDLPEAQKVYVLGQLANLSDTKENLQYAADQAQLEGFPSAAACLRGLAARADSGTYL